jgi:hypothetical protein
MRFDALVGLFGMIEIVKGRRQAGHLSENRIRKVEGWILGQRGTLSRTAGAPNLLDFVAVENTERISPARDGPFHVLCNQLRCNFSS